MLSTCSCVWSIQPLPSSCCLWLLGRVELPGHEKGVLIAGQCIRRRSPPLPIPYLNRTVKMGFTEQSKNVIGAMRGLGESKSGPTKEIAESSSPGTSSQHVEEGAEPGPRPGVFKRMWLHLKRYWIWYSLAVVVSLAIFLPVL